MKRALVVLLVALAFATSIDAQEEHHHHPAPEHLGSAHLETSCLPAVLPAFDRATALLHSFAYDDADTGFADVARRDPNCAMAHWGRAMTHYHQLWDVPVGTGLAAGVAEVEQAETVTTGTPRERALIAALGIYYANASEVPAATRAMQYSDAMATVARDYPSDDEIATFYALSLIATAPSDDHSHARQKNAADILEPIWKRQPEHPGVPHYLIHAYDSAELASRGLAAARLYAKIAPSAPHALHMPSHIFTRLGLWEDSITSNIAARDAALTHGDVGEALHAMDYLTYAYLQRNRTAEAAREVATLKGMTLPSGPGFKISYAGNAMPVRLAIETRAWATASKLTPIPGSGPQVAAIVWWARALGKLRAGAPGLADADIGELQVCREALRAAGDTYWMAQTDALLKSTQAWRFVAGGDAAAAVGAMTAAADEEDGLEKLPLTPGPIVPAREQLGDLYLAVGKPREALSAYNAALVLAPGRLGALRGKAEAERRITRL